MPASHTRDSLHVSSDHRYDSIYIDRWHTLILRGDTVFRTDSIYVEKLRDIELHDTITVTQHDSIPYPVEIQSPPRRKPLLPFLISQARTIWRLHREDTPRFYKNCTLGFFLLLLALLAYIAIRFYLHR